MSKQLYLLSRNALHSSNPSLLNPLRRLPLRSFSTEAEPQQQPPPPPQEDSSIDPILKAPQGLAFGRLTGIAKTSLKTDIIHFLEGCKLSTSDIKVEYNRMFNQNSMLLQFPSRSSYDLALRLNTRVGNLYRLERIDQAKWNLTPSYDGKTVLLQGVPRKAVQEDIERFLSGFEFDANFQNQLRPGPTPDDPIRLVLVNFPTYRDAMNAFLTKNRGFCLNDPVTMRVLQ